MLAKGLTPILNVSNRFTVPLCLRVSVFHPAVRGLIHSEREARLEFQRAVIRRF